MKKATYVDEGLQQPHIVQTHSHDLVLHARKAFHYLDLIHTV